MKIAIVDSGIDKAHRRLTSAKINGISIKFQDQKLIYEDDFTDSMGHGTACASIIHKIIPEAELVAVKIFHENFLSKENLLIAALNWCLAEDEIKIINVSLGVKTSTPHPVLSEASRLAYEKGKIIVASANNDINAECYPAYYPWVFGVTSGSIKKGNDYGYLEESPIEFVGKGSIQRVAWKDNKDLIVTGTSYATPHITGIAARYLYQEPDLSFNDLKKRLISQSKNEIKPIQIYGNWGSFVRPEVISESQYEEGRILFNGAKKYSWIKNIGIYPVSEKEMKQFSEFEHLCKYPIAAKIDYPRTFNELKSTNIAIEKDIKEEIDAVDTFVLGYFLDHMWEANISHGKRLLKNALENGKNIFCYDKKCYDYAKDLLKIELTNNVQSKISMPAVDNDLLAKVLKYRYLEPVNKPVLAVIGTSNRQGKFTAQLRIKEILDGNGYKTSFLSTEPQGYFFGADFVFHIGHKGLIHFPYENRTDFIRTLLKGLCEFNRPDIIITGIQGGLAPSKGRYYANHDYLNSLNYLYGVLPDINICAINPQDSVQTIENAINAAEIYTNCKNIFYVMTPWSRNFHQSTSMDFIGENHYLTSDEYNKKVEYFEKGLNKPVLNIMEKSNDNNILRMIQDACS